MIPYKPNGLCFSADYTKLYVADTGVLALRGREERDLAVRPV